MKRILLTTLGYTGDALGVAFYHSQDENGQRQYCTGISVAEAGTKYILSKYSIDEIVVVASTTDAGNSDIVDEVSLKDGVFKPHARYKDYSEYEFYLYRLQQFMENIDIEAKGLMESISPERLSELREDMVKLRQQFGITQSSKTVFKSADTGDDKIHELIDFIGQNYSTSEGRYITYCLYHDMDSRYKMFPLDSNEDVRVRFIPIKKESDNNFDSAGAKKLLDDLEKRENGDITIYVDLQGFGFGDAFILFNVLQLYKEVGRIRIELAGIIQSTFDPYALTNPIIDEWERFELPTLLTGTYNFLNYGKSEGVCEYYNKHASKSVTIKNLLAGMKYVDEGISLCNIAALKYGVGVIREALKKGNDKNETGYDLLSNMIIRDYGAMLDGDDVAIPELLKWAIKKKLYQQALSIIESHIPEDMVKRGIFYYAKDENDIRKLEEELNVCYWNENVKCRYYFNDINHYMIKSAYREKANMRQRKDLAARSYAQMHVRRTHNQVDGALPAYSELHNDAMLEELLTLYMNIGNLRNEVCHAEMPAGALEGGAEIVETNRMEEVGKKLSHFVDMYQAACDRVRDVDFRSLELTSDVFRAYASSHRLAPFEQGDDGILEQNCSCMFNGKEVTIKIRMQDVPEE